jgi:hypothetical protein
MEILVYRNKHKFCKAAFPTENFVYPLLLQMGNSGHHTHNNQHIITYVTQNKKCVHRKGTKNVILKRLKDTRIQIIKLKQGARIAVDTATCYSLDGSGLKPQLA